MIERLKQHKLILIIFIIGIILIVTGTTYSFYKIKLEGQKTHFVSTDVISFTYKESEDKISITNMEPKSDTEGIKENYFEFNVASNLVKDMSINYEISILKTSTTNSFEENDVKAYLTDGNDNALVNPILISNLGNSKKIANAKVIYNNSFMYNNSNEIQTHTYRLRVWLKSDINMSKYTVKQEIDDSKTNISLTGCTFKFKVNVSTVEQNLDTSGANKPVLASNMIPVYYDEANSVWKKADVNNKDSSYQWYSYNSTGDKKGMWANSVTVKDTNRQTYLNATPGTTISMDDITTMWVWIPRFKVNTTDFGTISGECHCSNISYTTREECENIGSLWSCPNPRAIDVTFVKQNETAIDAFTFGNKELSGFWYGKFEVGGTLASSCTNETCNVSNIVVKPNMTSLRSQKVSSYFFASRSMEQPNNSFGFINSEVDTHMSKNNEWGAVAYLTHSIYGRCTDSTTCTEVGINNNCSYITGYGAPAGSKYNDTNGAYNTSLGKEASTTKNIYGIYDMSGGAYEYVMGVYNKAIGYSGFNGLPDAKYYNNYTGSSYTGHALDETAGWYSDDAYFPNMSVSWFLRGGHYGNSTIAGVFYFHRSNCQLDSNYSSRFVITNE